MARKAEFMIVRQYVIDAISTGNGQPVRFPSTRKLGEMLGVSQPTALRAIQDLITDGILASCKNGGTVSCPNSTDCKDVKIFGLLENCGKISFDNHYFCSINSAIALELTRRSECFVVQNLYLESPSFLDKNLQENSIAGLVLLDSRAQIAENARNLKSRGLPVVSFLRQFPGISSFYSPLKKQFYQVLKQLFSEQRTHILITSFQDEDMLHDIREGVSAACCEFGVPEGQVLIQEGASNEHQPRLEEMLNFGMKFEGVIFYPFWRTVYDLICRRMDVIEECRFVCDESSVYDELNYTGYVLQYDLRTAARKLVDNLLLQMAQPDATSVDELINFKIKYYKEGREL